MWFLMELTVQLRRQASNDYTNKDEDSQDRKVYIQKTILLSTFRTIFNKLHEIFNTLLQNRLCVR